MTTRLNPFGAHLDLVKPLIDFGSTVQKRLDSTVAELIKIRASQINGCAACLFMHARDAREDGETEMRIFMLDAWRESPLYSARAALEWTEALTRVSDGGAADSVYDALQAHFSEAEQIDITLLIGAINAFNRLNVGFRVRHPASVGREAA